MIPSPKVLAAVGTVLVAAAFAAGRLSAPECAPSIDFDHSRDVTAKADEKAKGAEAQQIATAAASSHAEKRKRTKTVKKPDGTVATTVDEIDSHDESTATALAIAHRNWQTESQKAFDDRERFHAEQIAAVRSSARTDWSVMAMAGANLPERERFFAGTVSRRVLGPFELGLFGSTRLDFAIVGGGRW